MESFKDCDLYFARISRALLRRPPTVTGDRVESWRFGCSPRKFTLRRLFLIVFEMKAACGDSGRRSSRVKGGCAKVSNDWRPFVDGKGGETLQVD